MRIPLASISVVWARSRGSLVTEEPVLIRDGGQFEAQFQRYIRSPLNRSKSTSWMRTAARAVSLLIEAHDRTAPQSAFPYSLERFAAFLSAGKYCITSADGLSHDIYRPEYTKRLLAIAAEYIGFCNEAQLQPRRTSASRDYSLLRHLSPSTALPRVQHGGTNPIVFPHPKLGAFFQAVWDGAASPAHAVRDQLLFLLLAYGGVRSSEPLHLWVDDVRIEGGGPVVFFYHPSYGPVGSGANPRATRAATLKHQYRLAPRHLLGASNSQHAGWKGMMLEEQSSHGERTRIHWLDPAAAHLFHRLHLQYITHIRPLYGAHHPYYFIALSGEAPGTPSTLESVRSKFDRAAQLAGIGPGITPHSFRHAYAQRLHDLGLSPAVIQTCLHHKSPASQRIYGRPGPETITTLIAKAMTTPSETDAVHRDMPWPTDPLELFAGMERTWRMLR